MSRTAFDLFKAGDDPAELSIEAVRIGRGF